MNGLRGLLGKNLHLALGQFDQVQVLQRLGAQLEQLHRQAVAFALWLLTDESQRFHGLQEAVDGRLGHGQSYRQFGDAGFLPLTQGCQETKNPEHGGHRFGLIALLIVFIHLSFL